MTVTVKHLKKFAKKWEMDLDTLPRTEGLARELMTIGTFEKDCTYTDLIKHYSVLRALKELGFSQEIVNEMYSRYF